MLSTGLQLALEVKVASGPTLKEFKETLTKNPEFQSKLQNLRSSVEEFASKYPMPGYDDY